MKRLGLALVIALHALTAAATLAHKGPFGKCDYGAKVSLISPMSCANGWSKPKYPNWDVSQLDLNDFPRQLTSELGPYTIVGIDLENRKVKIVSAQGDIKAWVDPDVFDCGDARNVGHYTFPTDAPGGFGESCETQTSVIDSQEVARLNNAGNSETGLVIRQKARAYIAEVQRRAASDNAKVEAAFDAATAQRDPVQMLKKARAELEAISDRITRIYGEKCERGPTEEELAKGDWQHSLYRDRVERSCATLHDTVSRIQSTLLGTGDSAKTLSDFKDNCKNGAQKARDPVAIPEAAEAVPQTNNSQLSCRMVMFYCLEQDERKDLLGELYFKENNYELGMLEKNASLPVGQNFIELHNGYLMGADFTPRGRRYGLGEAIDCAAFAFNRVLGVSRTNPDGTRVPPSVPDISALHRLYTREGGSAERLERYASCFEAIDLRADQRPVPGDFVLSHGHIAIVDHYDASSREIISLEAGSGSLGTVGYSHHPLFEPDCKGTPDERNHSGEWLNRPIRSDLRVLRYTGDKVKPGSPPCPIHLLK